MSVIGCVWGAHRRLQETHADEAIPYDWCEAEWLDRLQAKAPHDRVVPDWLPWELLATWRTEHPKERPVVERQRTLWEAS